MSTIETLMDNPLPMQIVAVGLLVGIDTWHTEGRSQPNDQPNPADELWTPADVRTNRQGAAMKRGQHEEQDFGAEVVAIMDTTRRWGAVERAVTRGWDWRFGSDGQVHRRQVEPVQARSDQLCARLDLQMLREARGAWCRSQAAATTPPGSRRPRGCGVSGHRRNGSGRQPARGH